MKKIIYDVFLRKKRSFEYNDFLLKSYTLAEIVVVMLIIAVVVAVTIGITKAKLDNIVSYTYYNAYSSLRKISTEMLTDWDPIDPVYKEVYNNQNNNPRGIFAYLFQPAYASFDLTTPVDPIDKCSPATGWEGGTESFGTCPSGTVWNSVQCKCVPITIEDCSLKLCMPGYTLNPLTCNCEKLQQIDFVTCPDGSKATRYDLCPPVVVEPDNPTPEDHCPSNLNSCQICDPATGVVSQNPDVVRTCADDTMEWSEEYCRCVQSARTLPRKGTNFCKLFKDYANTKSGTDETSCNGSAIASTITDFSDKEPDIILRNGLLIYNLHSNPEQIASLANNTQGGRYEGVDNTNEWGYTVYVDIDGAKGDSQLWSDVYPFYITLSGKVIPAYDSSHPGEYGGDSTRHLQVSVEYENYASGQRRLQWLAKSVPFKEGACISGYVGDATPYCTTNTVVTKAAECSTDGNSLCRLKQIMPVKFFF